VQEGGNVAASDLAVVVIGLAAREDLAAAVASLRAQSEVPEIIVVNSGGGDPAAKLADHLDHIRLIAVEAPLYVGAARNIGIDAARAPFVAFLSGDCRAEPDWVAQRLASHRAGARAVASAVAPAADETYWGYAAWAFLFGTRAPASPPALAPRYGASFERRVFDEIGVYNPALRVGEDTDLMRRLGDRIAIAWNRKVVTVHPGPRSMAGFLADMHGRGRRAARFQLARANRPLAGFASYVRYRAGIASQVASSVLKLSPADLRRYRPAFWLAAIAYVAGVWRGVVALRRSAADLRRSAAAQSRGSAAEALRYARRAAAGNREDVDTQLRLVDLLRRAQGA
jgi:glycosyltransferase involved in cell wall biosynthesis